MVIATPGLVPAFVLAAEPAVPGKCAIVPPGLGGAAFPAGLPRLLFTETTP